MYLKLLLLLTCTYFVKPEDDSGQRYIDLLPEEEKQAFLDQVARRLMKEVKKKKSPLNESGEISNKELDDHGDFVKRIIEEESGNVRRQRNIEEADDEVKELTVRGLDIPETEKSAYIDLTLRNGKQLSRNNNEKEIVIDDKSHSGGYEIPVETVYDKDKSNDNVTSAVDKATLNKILTSREESEGLDIQVRGLRRYAKPRTHTKIGHFDPDDETTEKISIKGDSSSSTEEKPYDSDSHPPNFTATVYESDDEVYNDKVSSEVNENTGTSDSITTTITTSKTVPTEKTTSSTSVETSTRPTSTSPTSTTKNGKIDVQNKTETKKTLRSAQYEDIRRFQNDSENSSSELLSTIGSTKNYVNDDITEITHAFHDTTETTYVPITQSAEDVSLVTAKPHSVDPKVIKRSNNRSENLNSNESITNINNNIKDSNKSNGKKHTSIGDDEDVVLTTTTTELRPITDSTTYDVTEDITESSNVFDDTTETTYVPITQSAEDVSLVTAKPHSVAEKVIKRSNNRSENLNSNESITNINNNIKDSNKSNGKKHTSIGADEDVVLTTTTTELRPITDSTTYDVTEDITESSNVFDDTTETTYVPSTQLDEAVSPVTATNLVNEKVIERSSHSEINKNSNNSDSIININYYNKSNVINVSNGTDEHVFLTKNTELQPITVHPGLASTASTVIKALEHIMKNKGSDTTDRNNVSTTREVEIFNNLVKALRQGTQFKFEEGNGENKNKDNGSPKLWFDEPTSTRKTLEPYYVYEIPAGEASFVVKTKIRRPKKVQRAPNNQEQPYYAPVYNFSPENAYFNAYNRLGPNDGQNNDDSYAKDDPFDFDKYHENVYNNIRKPPRGALRKFKFTKKKPEDGAKTTLNKPMEDNYKLKMPLVVKKPKFTDIYFNADDYLDMDYYFGRMDKPYVSSRKKRVDSEDLPSNQIKSLPNSNEEAHVRNSINKGIAKNYMSGVRQLLFRHQIFGYVPEVTTVKTTSDEPHYRAYPLNKESDYLIVVPEHRNKLPSKGNDKSIILSLGVKSNKNSKKQSLVRFNNNNNYTGVLERDGINENNIPNVIGKVKRHAGIKMKNPHKIYRNGKINKKQGKRKPYTIREILRHEGNNKEPKTLNEPAVDKPQMGTIREILSISDARDVFIQLEQLLEANIPLGRRGGYKEIQPYLGVLSDMIRMNDQSLEKYDWLGTTVDILSALEKLTVAIETLLNGGKLHPSDTQLLKYIQYMYVTSKASLVSERNYKNTAPKQQNNVELIKHAIDEDNEKSQKRKTFALPRNRHRKREYLKAKGLINRVWLYIRGKPDNSESEKRKQRKDLKELQEFLDDVRTSLYDLHNALKHIAIVTKYNKQSWYQNLKQLYLNVPEKKQLLEVLLHLTAIRLFDLIEDSAMYNLEESYIRYIETHQEQVQRTKDEMVILLKVMSEIKELIE